MTSDEARRGHDAPFRQAGPGQFITRCCCVCGQHRAQTHGSKAKRVRGKVVGWVCAGCVREGKA